MISIKKELATLRLTLSVPSGLRVQRYELKVGKQLV